MDNNNKKFVFWGCIAALTILIVYNSKRKIGLTEVTETQEQKTFDNSTLPARLQPPYRMAEGDPMPQKFAKQRILGLNSQPRFDGLY